MSFIMKDVYINIGTIGFANSMLEFFNMTDLKSTLPDESKIYPFSIDGYVGILDIVNYEVKSYTVYSQKAKERANKIIRSDIEKRLNNEELKIQPSDKILFNVQSGELIGSVQTNTLFSQIFRKNPCNFKDAVGDESLIWACGKFMRTTQTYVNMLSLKIRIAKEIFEADEISELLVGLFLEINEVKLTEYARIDDITENCKPSRPNFDLYKNSFGKYIDTFVK